MDLLVNLCIPEEKEEERMQWNGAIALYTDTMKVCLMLFVVAS